MPFAVKVVGSPLTVTDVPVTLTLTFSHAL